MSELGAALNVDATAEAPVGIVPAAADPASLVAAIEADRLETEQAADAEAVALVPQSPTEYRMPERGPTDVELKVHEVQGLQMFAHGLGLLPGEFKLMVAQGHMHDRTRGGSPMSSEELQLAGARVEADLQRAHGDRWESVARDARRAIDKATSINPELGRVLLEMAVSQRHFCELLASVGRRNVHRSK